MPARILGAWPALAGFRIEQGPVDHGQGQAHLSAEQPAASQGSRLPSAYAYPSRAGDPGCAQAQRPDPFGRLTCEFPGYRVRSSRVRRVLEEGSSSHGDRVVVFLAPGSGEVAFVAGRRVGGAVERNRARRILRAAWRQVARDLSNGMDVVLVARPAIRGAKSQDLVDEMKRLVRGGDEA